MTVVELRHFDRSGSLLWGRDAVPNLLHAQGQEYIVKALFCGGAIPPTYYVGLDTRLIVNVADTLASVVEPQVNGYNYIRYGINSSAFTAVFTSHWVARSATALFHAVGGSWGVVRGVFLATGSATQGYLISTSTLPSPRTVNDGDILTLKVELGPGG